MDAEHCVLVIFIPNMSPFRSKKFKMALPRRKSFAHCALDDNHLEGGFK